MADEASLSALCGQLEDTLANEREVACNVLKAELGRQHTELVSRLMVQLRASRNGNGSSAKEAALNPAQIWATVEPGKAGNGEAGKAATPAPSAELQGERLVSSSSRYEIVTTPTEDREKEVTPTVSRKQSVQEVLDKESPAEDNAIRRLVESTRFESFIFLVITLSIVNIAIDLQLKGLDMGFKMSFGEITSSPEVSMAWMRTVLQGVDFVVGCIFVGETVLKLAGFRQTYFYSFSNWMDLSIVVVWLSETIFGTAMGSFDPFILRLVRLLKVLRLLRLVRGVQNLDSLFLLIESIKASRSVCFWSTVLLMVIQMAVAMILNMALRTYMEDMNNTVEERQAIFEYFGTFTRSMVTMFELTFGNFTTVLRMLMEIWEWYAVIIITFKVLVGFMALRIISGIFMTETLRVCNNNDLIMVMQKKRKQKENLDKMDRLFKAADNSGDGHVTMQEFLMLFQQDTVKTWLSAQELDVGDPEKFFRDLAGDDDTITANEMLQGVNRMKGAARSMEIIQLMKDQQALASEHRDLQGEHRCLMDLVRSLDQKVGKLGVPSVYMYDQGNGPVQRVSHC